ncbi:MAG: hypothetical protein AAFR33_07350 [Pseudomonadota bacterium]
MADTERDTIHQEREKIRYDFQVYGKATWRLSDDGQLVHVPLTDIPVDDEGGGEPDSSHPKP